MNLGISYENMILLEPNQEISLDDILIHTIPSYNLDKDFHKKENNWLGYIIKLDNVTYYIPGDTDMIPEMDHIQDIDVLFIPIGGVYTMDCIEAAKAVEFIISCDDDVIIPEFGIKDIENY